MSERCPLKSNEYWDDNGATPIPWICQQQCRDIWEEVIEKPGNIVGNGNDPLDCWEAPDSFSISLQRAREDRFGSERIVKSISQCIVHEAQRSTEVWTFECPYN